MGNKYGAKKVRADGHTFDSNAEFARYCELKILERAGEITMLKVHPRYELRVRATLIGHYKPDFAYYEKGKLVVEDVKSKATMTQVSSLRIRLFEACFDTNVKLSGKNVPKIRKFR